MRAWPFWCQNGRVTPSRRARRANQVATRVREAGFQMSEQANRHDELDQALLALDDRAMVLEELDGFIAGLLVLPEQVPPGEWFAAAFGFGKGRHSVFASIAHANAVLDLVMAYHDEIARTLTQTPELYQPRYPVDPIDGSVIWELWIDGFAAAVDLRQERFKAYRNVDGDVGEAALSLMVAIELARDENADRVENTGFDREAAADIRHAVLTLNRHRRSGAPVPGAPAFIEQPNPFASFGKVGRNDPCPCGSGQKYKRCCGAN
ncbi:UPF0149 family protein [Bradyrhizobium sp. SZCCHNPS1003]|uniref:UPF0149 family protein n=1 Tax=Bradyrhizobium sp. SZCCHNPS1003 TaxID=3057330 RepID=UPI0028E5BA53|nr:UPF0149 family protein [Bradyrhizobium sp. SZCCHNPS1003]